VETRPINTATKIRVMIVDDSRDITSILVQCVDGEVDMMSVGTLRSADELVKQVDERRPDVVLLDMTMPGKDPLAALRELTQSSASEQAVRVILFSGSDEHEVHDAATQAGACGFLSKQAEVPVILNAIRAAARWRRGADPFIVWP
jgi:two-component system invasion response regulator UvrY